MADVVGLDAAGREFPYLKKWRDISGSAEGFVRKGAAATNIQDKIRAKGDC